jgi:hypothetical protein
MVMKARFPGAITTISADETSRGSDGEAAAV